MLSRLRYFALCGMILSMSIFTANFFVSNVFAQSKEGQKAHADPHQYSKWDHGGHAGAHKGTGDPRFHGCKQAACSQQHKYAHGGHGVSDMMGLVHRAKKELLKEKMKTKLEAKMGQKLDKAADLLVDAMLEEYRLKKEDKKLREELQKKLKEIFSNEGQSE